jgi:hypothetical protein
LPDDRLARACPRSGLGPDPSAAHRHLGRLGNTYLGRDLRLTGSRPPPGLPQVCIDDIMDSR